MIIGQAPQDTGDLIKDGSDDTFMADVVETSKTTPVIVDFWAPWCGPCRQLGPVLEKVVKEAGGAVKLVKIDTEQHPAFAQQLRVQSIPAVFAFKDGQPVDAFMGAQPESQVKAFIQKLAGGPSPAEEQIEALLAEATAALGSGDINGAAQRFAAILQAKPDHLKAIAGMARCYLQSGERARAEELVSMAGPDAKDPELDSVRAALQFSEDAPDDLSPLKARIEADAEDFVARIDYAKGLAAQGAFEPAIETLFPIIEKDRDWNGGQARRVLLEIFEAAGPSSEAAKNGRRRLSSILFA